MMSRPTKSGGFFVSFSDACLLEKSCNPSLSVKKESSGIVGQHFFCIFVARYETIRLFVCCYFNDALCLWS